ncbi:MAG TPA: hypothetical protein VMU98_00790 [Acidimicrobiales bacterium]|nr:hypothetical protein [Acidimicrobiales bacterium]
MGRFERVVRCSAGHLFTTTWVPLGSLKAVRLGNRRYQFCPIGRHWASVKRVDPTSLSDDERTEALAHHDIRIP